MCEDPGVVSALFVGKSGGIGCGEKEENIPCLAKVRTLT